MKQLITLILLVGSLAVFGQFGINIHQTNLPFVGLAVIVSTLNLAYRSPLQKMRIPLRMALC